MNRTWTIFGASHLIGDLWDTIVELKDTLQYVVLNQSISDDIRKKIPKCATVIDLKDYRPFLTDCSIFGYAHPNKEAFLTYLQEGSPTNFTNLIHPFSHIAQSSILGSGNYVGPGVVIASRVRVGNFNFLNRNSSVGHDTVIGSFNHLCPRATICGNCGIGNKNTLGAGTILIDNRNIEDEITTGAGAVVTKSLNAAGTYVGIPAKALS